MEISDKNSNPFLANGDYTYISKLQKIDTSLNKLIDEIIAGQSGQANIAAALALKANLDAPAFTGNPTAPTAGKLDSDTTIATTAFCKLNGFVFDRVDSITSSGNCGNTEFGSVFSLVHNSVKITASLVGAPRVGDSITFVNSSSIAHGINGGVNFIIDIYPLANATSMDLQPNEKITLVWDGLSWRATNFYKIRDVVLTGNPTTTTQTTTDNTDKLATTKFVKDVIASSTGFAPLTNPNFVDAINVDSATLSQINMKIGGVTYGQMVATTLGIILRNSSGTDMLHCRNDGVVELFDVVAYTQERGDNTDNVATTGFVQQAITNKGTVSLGGAFGSQTFKISKIGNVVTLTISGLLTYSSANTASSAAVIPIGSRPEATVIMSTLNAGIGALALISISASGVITVSTYDNDFVLMNSTQVPAFTISYVV